ncbi:MAG: biopolymer transporter ExbD [Phycisphaerales bacterium]|jgi:biopolymer transport protein ExbD|nr:biopolymer transporter ExbD [Phycisphaerales bacterium]
MLARRTITGSGSAGGSSHGFEAVNVTPMIDVVMCLIVFYLLVGNLAATSRPPVDLPREEMDEALAPDDPIVLTLDRATDGAARLLLGADEIVAASLENELIAARTAHPQAALEVRAARTLSYGSVRPALEAARRAGFAGVRLVAAGGAP